MARAEKQQIIHSKKWQHEESVKRRKAWIGAICDDFIQLSMVHGTRLRQNLRMCNDRESNLLTDKTMVTSRWD